MKSALMLICAGFLLGVIAICPFELSPNGQQNQAESQNPNQPRNPGTGTVQMAGHNTQPEVGTVTSEGKAKPIEITKVPRPDAWYKTYVIATCLLAIAGGLGVRYAIKTLKAIESQVGVMSVQIALQKTAMQQWLVIGNWSSTLRESENCVVIKADISNPTGLPLTILCHEAKAGMSTGTWRSNHLLAPNESFSIRFPGNVLTPQTKADYMGGGTQVVVRVEVTYRNCFKEDVPQTFFGLLKCSRDVASFTPLSEGSLSETTNRQVSSEQTRQQNPN